MEQRIRESKKREALSRMKKEGIRNLCLGIAGIAGLLILWDMGSGKDSGSQNERYETGRLSFAGPYYIQPYRSA